MRIWAGGVVLAGQVGPLAGFFLTIPQAFLLILRVACGAIRAHRKTDPAVVAAAT